MPEKTGKVEKETKEAAPPPAAEEVKEEKPEKTAKPQKKKKEEKGVFTLYKTENDKVVRLRPVCERCGPGYFMADHHDRYTCGHCGFTRYKPTEK